MQQNRTKGKELDWRGYLELTAGSVICVLGLQLFITPLGLYNGGSVGTSQIIRTLLTDYFHLELNFDLAGIFNLLINIPLMLMAYQELSQKFFVRTCFVVGVQTVFLSAIKLDYVIIQDTLTSCIVGGIIAGYGCGVILRAGGSGAGFDILGVWLSKQRIHIGVGTLVMIMNGCVYLACALLFSFETAIYSIIYSVCCSLMTNQVHTQNINCGVIIVSDRSDLHEPIMAALERGVTYWSGSGGHTYDGKTIYYVAVSKYEEEQLRSVVRRLDEGAFIVVDENKRIYGNYARRLN